MLRDGFDVDQVSSGWSIDLDQPFPSADPNGTATETGQTNGDDGRAEPGEPEGSTVALYEDAVQDPSMDALQLAGRNTHSTTLEVETIDTQTFLSQQLKVLDAFKQKNTEEASREDSRHKPHRKLDEEHLVGGGDDRAAEAKVLEHIGPVQFNMGGIQVDADDMVQRLKVFTFLHPSASTQLVCSPSPPGTPSLRLVPRTRQPNSRRSHGVHAAHGHGEPPGLLPRPDEQARRVGQVDLSCSVSLGLVTQQHQQHSF